MMKNYIKYLLLIQVVVVTTLASCKKYADPPPYFEEDDTTSAVVGKRKILLIGIDGLAGKEFETIAPPNVKALLAKSKYSYNNVSDAVTTDAAGWKTLLSGVSYSSHMVKDSTFETDAEPVEGQSLPSYPSIFYFIIRSAKPDLQSRFISSWGAQLNTLAPEASFRTSVADDAAVKTAAVEALKNNNDDLVVVHFNAPAKAGRSGAFLASNAGYKAAVLQTDTYINEVMTALKARPQYNKGEDWLVIIAGTHGGKGNSYGGQSDEETQVPIIYYNELFKESRFTRDGALSSALIKGNFKTGLARATAPDAPEFNPSTGQFTIQMNINGSRPQTNYPHFLSKVQGWTNSKNQPGWTFYSWSGSGQWSVRVAGSGGAKAFEEVSDNIFDNNWHKLTMVIYDTTVGGVAKRYLKRFIDGKRITPSAADFYDITSVGNISNSLPLLLGYGADDHEYGGSLYTSAALMPFYSNDICFFNTALTDQEIRDNLCLTNMAQHPKYANLKAYFPGSEGFGGKLTNKINESRSLNLEGDVKWETQLKFPCSFASNPPAGQVTKVINNTDVAQIIFYWLKINTATSWNLKGNNWLSAYESEFIEIK